MPLIPQTLGNKFDMKNYLILLSCCLCTSYAFALESDRTQPIEIYADAFHADEVKQTAIYTGNVVIQQGTLRFHAEQLELKISAKGYRQAYLSAKDSQVTKFKQQKDNKTPGIEEWIHAQARTMTYDEQRDLVILDGQARLIRTENNVQKDITEGNKIIYNMRTAQSTVEGRVGSKTQPKERVTTIIAPRTTDNNTKPRSGVDLTNSLQLQ